uniref:(northern house mosquito) hypothetical protein n=1 Tax=Culex pipiens TaxID=7175 RepID=A0A8D8BE07_CULPI
MSSGFFFVASSAWLGPGSATYPFPIIRRMAPGQITTCRRLPDPPRVSLKSIQMILKRMIPQEKQCGASSTMVGDDDDGTVKTMDYNLETFCMLFTSQSIIILS